MEQERKDKPYLAIIDRINELKGVTRRSDIEDREWRQLYHQLKLWDYNEEAASALREFAVLKSSKGAINGVCNLCGGSNSVSRKQCYYCGIEFYREGEMLPNAESAAEAGAATVSCSKCGMQISDDSRFCGHCGNARVSI